MGLSHRSIERAYEVFHELKSIIPLDIPSWPEDMGNWDDREKEDPELNLVYGYDRKTDGSWENIYFFVQNPSQELIDKFNQLKGSIPNTSMANPYRKNPKIWIFGWI